MKLFLAFLLVGVVLLAPSSSPGAQPSIQPTPEDPAHQELRIIKDDLVSAFNQRNYDGFLQHVHTNVVATWQNAEVARHPEGLRAFMKKMSEGEKRVVESVQARVRVDELSSLYNDKKTGIAFGEVEQDFKFADGLKLTLKSRWTGTFIKEDGRWWLAAIHVSANMFKNPLLELTVKKTATWTGLGAGAVGIVAGLTIGKLRKGKAPPAA